MSTLFNLGSFHTAPFLLWCVFVASKLPVHITPFLYKNEEKNIRFCAFTLLRFCEAHYCILERFQKPPFLCVHIDQMRFKNLGFFGYPLLIACLKPPFLWRFCAD